MFTGLVAQTGRLTTAPAPSGRGGLRLDIEHGPELAARLSPGASLAVSGVCLTITEQPPGRSVVELSPETVARTTLGGLAAGDRVNLEPALRLGDPLGGHWVQGHVDTTLELLGRQDLGEHRELVFSLPEDLDPYLVEKGSVTLDGVSLTVARRWPDRFSVALIPHTLEITNLSDRVVGDRLNVEIDVLAKYVHQAVLARGVVS
ncbi:MAG: riboflavin synthase [Acidobacteria bacterium]|nr:riboflavin synthase [Acidobacteriota bacterium]